MFVTDSGYWVMNKLLQSQYCNKIRHPSVKCSNEETRHQNIVDIQNILMGWSLVTGINQ